jgi:basic amino acid/polyamine antiporter, APA family
LSPDGDAASSPGEGALLREIGTPGAIFMGLGSIVGTGLFVSLGIAAGVAGNAILLALPLAGLLALFNGLSSAQLAAAHPVSGGTYEYGYRVLTPALGFSAGTMFLLAKSASAATAALGLAGYGLLLVGVEPGRGVLPLPVWIGASSIVVLALLVGHGIRSSNRVNLSIVGITLAILTLFLAAGAPRALESLPALLGSGGGEGPGNASSGIGPLLHATALLFVAFTGYGRIATLGEEVRDPSRTIPRAIWATLIIVTVLYMGAAAVALATLGAEGFAEATAERAAPLQEAAAALGVPGLALLVGFAAVTAMIGVLLNLLLGLSRVVLGMGRRRDLPGRLAEVHSDSGSPRAAVAVVAITILVLVLIGDVRVTWSFSAFTVLIYYGITNLAALRLPEADRRYPRWVAVLGLVGCLLLAFQIEPFYWLAGGGLLGGALAVRAVVRGWGRVEET